MKIYNIFSAVALGAVALISFNACDDFEEVNTDPLATSADKVKPYWFLNKAIIQDQQNPNDAERVFVLYWAALAHQDGENGSSIACGGGNDEWRGCEYSLVSKALTYANTAITICDENIGSGSAHEKEFFPNIKQFARIYRAYLLSEFSDCFGPAPTLAGQGTETVEFQSVKEVYYYALQELAEAAEAINTDVVPSSDEAKTDPAYGWDAAKWKAYAISMRMRLAMRLSECDEAKAKSEFEAAVQQGKGIETNDQIFQIKEEGGWDDWTAVMSRVWDWQSMSATMANLACNLGGAKSVDALAKLVTDPSVYEPYVTDASKTVGVYAPTQFAEYTDNPTKQYFFKGLPEYVDPRALYFFHLPGDYYNRTVNGYMSGYDAYRGDPTATFKGTEEGEEQTYDFKYSWNGLTCGWGRDDVAVENPVWNGNDGAAYYAFVPQLADEFRNCATTTTYRFFFGPWETYFLLAEAAVRGWNAGIDAETAYNKGIELSFEYNGMSDLYAAYIASESYNRVGTSVKFTHTAEPVPTTMKRIVAETGVEEDFIYEYPDASKILYKGHALNDQLTKIMTQLYLANTPYLPLENWSNHRRLGLPFFEIPVSVSTISYMPAWQQTSYQTGQTEKLFPQRMQFPSSLENADKAGYDKAVELLGGEGDNSMTPLWWAIGGH